MKLSFLEPVDRTQLPSRLARPQGYTLRSPVEGLRTAQQQNGQDVVEEWVQVNVILPSACTHHTVYPDECVPSVVTKKTSRGSCSAR
jgi:hypothetical protein